MYRIPVFFLVIVLSLVINGCGSAGIRTDSSASKPSSIREGTSTHSRKKIQNINNDAEKAEKFIKGKTTYAEVLRELGEPLRVSDFNDGKWVDYEIETTSPQGVVKENILHMRFDKYNVLYLKVVN